MKLTGPRPVITDPLVERLRKMPLPVEARPTSGIRFGLIVPPSPFVMPRGWEWANYAPFEGPAMISGLLKGLGYKVSLFDLRENYVPEYVAECAKDVDILGISTWGDSYNYLKVAVAAVKAVRPDLPIVLGGPFVSSIPKLLMENIAADYAVVGEGELTLTEFMDWFSKNEHARPISEIAGLYWRDEKGVVHGNPARAQLTDLDALPFQDFTNWSRFDTGVIPEIFMSYSRGCIANCTFCYRAFPNLNTKSVDRVRREIEYYKQWGFRFVWWSDLTFITDPEYCHQMMDGAWSAHDFRSIVFSRVTGINVPVLKHMKDHGLDLVLYGMESISKEALASYHKGTSKNAIINAIQMSREAKVKIGGLFIVGAPSDTHKTMEELIDFCREFKEVTRVKYLSALPGTANYNQFVKDGVIKDQLAHLDFLSRERSIEEDIDEPGFVKFTPNLTLDELRDVYQKVNGVIEHRPYDYRNPENLYLPGPDGKFFKRPVYMGTVDNQAKIFTGDVDMKTLASIERQSVEETMELRRIRKKA